MVVMYRGVLYDPPYDPPEVHSLAERITELEEERDKLHNQIMVLTHTKEFDYVDDPQFVTNFNNIDIAFQVHSLKQQAKGLEDYVSKTMDNSYILHLDPEDIHHCILINLNATALRLLEKAKALKEQGE